MADGGFDNLVRKATENTRETLDEIFQEARGDSPIEKLFFTALQYQVWRNVSEYSRFVVVDTAEDETLSKGWQHNIDVPSLIIRPQAQLEGWRVDFLIHAYDFARKGGPKGWRRLIVECDGHDFHERTKQQAAKDRSRDRHVQLSDYSVLRFTGSEIYKDAWGCADQVIFWAVKGFP
jgi:very-short-patch-repair endonuclease